MTRSLLGRPGSLSVRPVPLTSGFSKLGLFIVSAPFEDKVDTFVNRTDLNTAQLAIYVTRGRD